MKCSAAEVDEWGMKAKTIEYNGKRQKEERISKYPKFQLY